MQRSATPLFYSLRFRIAAVIILLASLMLGSALYTYSVTSQQRTLDVLLHTSGQLQLTMQTLEKQSLNYLENAPRDYPTYYRDVKLYFEDLKAHISTFDIFTEAFMHGEFPPDMTGLDMTLYPKLDADTMQAVTHVETLWADYRAKLMESLGGDSEEPRLEWAAEFIARESDELEAATDDLAAKVRHQIISHTKRIAWVNGVLLGFYVIVSVVILFWVFSRLIRRLTATDMAFQQVAQGDFGHQIPVSGRDEITSLTRSFNQLSRRVHGLVELTTRIQRGGDLDEAMKFIVEDFPGLIPADWVGMVFSADDENARMEKAFTREGPTLMAPINFTTREDSLLKKALESTTPHHVATVEALDDEFARWLTKQGVRDVILLPIREETPVPGILVIGSHRPSSYTEEHLALITNIGLLVSLTFARTVQLVERTRLAAIGQFTAGIVHELRTPLATIHLALEHLRQADLQPTSSRRAGLAADEADRMSRLLSDVLEYARPLTLKLQPVDLNQLLRDTIANRGELCTGGRNITIDAPDDPILVVGEKDRLIQVILNLTKNALEAAPENSRIQWTLRRDDGNVLLSVRNPGEPIEQKTLERLFEPFYTTKAGGTGLGLSIVKRIIDALGGQIVVQSSEEDGTRFELQLVSA